MGWQRAFEIMAETHGYIPDEAIREIPKCAECGVWLDTLIYYNKQGQRICIPCYSKKEIGE